MKLSTSHLFSLLAVSSQLVIADSQSSTGLPDLDAILKDMNVFIDSTMTKGQDIVIEIEDNSKSFFKDISSSSKKLFETAKQKQTDLFNSLFSSFSNGNAGSFGPQIIEIELDDGDLPTFEQLKASPNGPLVQTMEQPEYVEIVYTVVTDEPTSVDFNLDNNLMWIEPSDLSNVNYHLQDSGPEFTLKQGDYYSPSIMDDCGSARAHALRHHGRFSFVALSGLLVLLSMSLFLFPLMVILSYRRRQQDRGLEYGSLPTSDSDLPPQYFNDEKTRTSNQPEVVSPVVVVEEVEEEIDENQPLNPSQNHH